MNLFICKLLAYNITTIVEPIYIVMFLKIASYKFFKEHFDNKIIEYKLEEQ